ncbi:MAG TPA: hypothetical protein VE093_40250, partial [Polyangiaceae bacterium]|nr:hypothetical protein [Polyangiaceae bacterium]
MRIAVERSDAKVIGGSATSQGVAGSTLLERPGPPMPRTAPPADLLALQHLIENRSAPPQAGDLPVVQAKAGPEPADPAQSTQEAPAPSADAAQEAESESTEKPKEPPPKRPRAEVKQLRYVCIFVGDDLYGTQARRFAKTVMPEHHLIEASSMEGAMIAMREDARAALQGGAAARVDEVVLIAHGNHTGFIKIPLIPGERGITPAALASLQEEFKAGAMLSFQEARSEVVGLFDQDTNVIVRGCRVGRSQETVQALAAFFGGQARVYAAKEYQAFTRRHLSSFDKDTREASIKAFDHLAMQGFVPKETVATDDEKVRWVAANLPDGYVPESFLVDEKDVEKVRGAGADDAAIRSLKDYTSAQLIGLEKWGVSAPAKAQDAELDPMSASEIVALAKTHLARWNRLQEESPGDWKAIGEEAWWLVRCHYAWSRKAAAPDVRESDPLAGMYMPGLVYDMNELGAQASMRPDLKVPLADAFLDAAIVTPAAPPSEEVEDLSGEDLSGHQGAVPEEKSGEGEPVASATPTTGEVLEVHTAEFRNLLRYLHDQEPVERILRALSMLPRPHITVLWGYFMDTEAMTRGQRGWLLDQLTLQHLHQYARECVATFQAFPVPWRVHRIRLLLRKTDPRDTTLALYLTYDLPQEDLDSLREYDGGLPFLSFRDHVPADARERFQKATGSEREAKLLALEAQRIKEAQGEAYARGSDKGADAEDRRRRYDALRTELTRLLEGDVDAARAKEAHAAFVKSLGHDPSGAEIRAVVRELEPDGSVERFIRALPEADRYDPRDRRIIAFLAVLQALPPESAMALAVDLLAAGAWSSVDAVEARLAYEVMRVQPLAVQEALRSRDDGQLIARMERALPADFVLKSRHVGLARDERGALDLRVRGFGTASDAAEQARAREADVALDKGSMDRFQEAAKALGGSSAELERTMAFVNTARGAARDDLIRRLDVAGAQKRSLHDAWQMWSVVVSVEAAARDALVRRLDALGLFEPMLASVGAARLFSSHRAEALALLGSRDPARNIGHLRRLCAPEKMSQADAQAAFL